MFLSGFSAHPKGPERLIRNPQSPLEHRDNGAPEGKEVIELRGGEIFIPRPELPIRIFLGGYPLDIVPVEVLRKQGTVRGGTVNADFLIIDPRVIKDFSEIFSGRKNGPLGFKGIRENDPPVVLGRETLPDRFCFPPIVSRRHVAIGWNGEQLWIEDLNSTNGTRIELPLEKKKEVNSKWRQDLADFRRFIETHKAEIQQVWSYYGLGGLREYFYSRFLISDNGEEEQLLSQSFFQRYTQELEEMQRNLVNGTSIAIEKNKDWFYLHINGGSPQGEMGRLYLNIRPPEVTRFFQVATEAFVAAGLRVDMKIPRSPYNLRRSDKIVIYFNAAEEKMVLELIERLYSSNPNIFEDRIPRFTSPITDTKGNIMRGVGFGEEHGSGASFGEIRAHILADLYTKMLSHPESYNIGNIETFFRKQCRDYGIDENNPAFNQDGSNRFPEIFRRTR